MKFSCKAHCHNCFYQIPVASFYHVYEDMENLDWKTFFQQREFFPYLHTVLHSYLFSQVLSILPLHAHAEPELKFSTDVCPLLSTACSHHNGPGRPEKHPEFSFPLQCQQVRQSSHTLQTEPLLQLRTFTPAKGTFFQPYTWNDNTVGYSCYQCLISR